ncbi:M28 family metallopeptidase [Marinifilum caeruleilacunae]|uniref:M28 family peptidase n=1 Tax=Marinifilum caeruleilacunae TaxID=2499076 RepID=A0ABX1WV68_9BACT|nr:M28 family metallopeptidase [Marinifilum caeruleilacunae]NOU59809.1 M28 family peptidase [Marinifilum caeruleilacunae]
MNRISIFLGLFALIIVGACSNQANEQKTDISIDRMIKYIKDLSADEFMGRKPFSEGELKTINYIADLYKEIGLEPVNGDSYFQEVPLVEVSLDPPKNLKLNYNNEEVDLSYANDFVVFSRRLQENIELKNSELIFAGYGIVAPEYNRNDYQDLDVKGKTVVVMVNDPGFGKEDKSNFKGNEMTYYGRWTYKYEEAARQGAAGLLIIHQTKPAGYPWSVVLNSASVPKLYQQPNDDYMSRCIAEGWITWETAEMMFSKVGKNLQEELDKASQKNFSGYSLEAKASVSFKNSARFDKTQNVLGVLKGSDLADEYIFYTAHWDHLGIGPKMNGDSIYNGAVDNGTSLAWMFEIARAFKAMPVKPRRSIVFLAPSAEESGLNGSGYYVDHPIFPLEKTVANFNNDLMLPYGRMKDVMITGYGQSELEDYVAEIAKEQNRYILPDPNPQSGMYFRSDHFSFARVGVPALFARGNNDHIEKGKEYMLEKERYWLANHYHKPADEYEDWWDLTGVADDAELLFKVGWKIANMEEFPKWKEGSEFKKVREDYMNK